MSVCVPVYVYLCVPVYVSVCVPVYVCFSEYFEYFNNNNT